ncbi:MAG: beta-propeller fold lactonase family protein [Nitrospira sp.]|nr:beta-propeller fold lactonase family protein [Nitrospira sp.]
MYSSIVQQRSRVLVSGLSVCLLVAIGAGCSVNNGNNNSPSGSPCAPTSSLPGFPVPQGPLALTGGFAYAVHTSGHKVVWYKVESSGALTSRGEICAGFQPTFIAANNTRKLAYVTNYSSNTVSAYTIGTDGVLASLGTPVPTGNGPASISVDWTRNLVYVANFDSDSVSVYEIESNGALTRAQDLQTGLGPNAIVVDSTGKFVYVAHFKGDTLSAYKVNATTRKLETAPIATYNLGLGGPNAITIHPTGLFMYVTNEDTKTVSAYSINTTNGELGPLVGSPYSTGNGPEGVTVDLSGKFAYVSDGQADTISSYTINAGVLTAGPKFAANGDPEGITVDPTGKFVYVVHRDTRDIFVYTINPATGALTFQSSASL